MKSEFKATLLIIGFIASTLVYSQNTSNYPEFSWNTVPIAYHFGKKKDILTSEEAKFIASKSNFVVLEKAHGAPKYKYSEDAILEDAKQLKKYNDKMKVVFYWNAFLDYDMYKAHEEYNDHPEWWLKTKNGELDLKNNRIKRYDLSNDNVREWWVDVAKKNVNTDCIDGVFFDALVQVTAPSNKNLWGEEKYNAIQQGLKNLIKETRDALEKDKLIVYNGIRSTPGRNIGNNFPENTDAIMIEHFGNFNSKTKESMLLDIKEMEKAGKEGKIVVFKTWPGFSWLDKAEMSLSNKKKRIIAEENITFPLAAFLAGAQEHSYFIYNWGYRLDMGVLEWYPEFDKPLGKPLNEMQTNGWILTRKYEHADVWVDLENKKAKIDWHK